MHAPDELLAVVLVGIGRALALPEPAERAPHDAHVGDVDVAVHHERDRLPGELLAQLVGRLADLLDGLRPRLREQRGQLIRAQRQPVAAPLDRARHELGADRRRGFGAPGPAPGDEAPVLHLDRVHHRRRHPLGVDVPRVHAQPLGQRVSLALQLLAHLVRRGEWMLGGDVVAVGAQTAEIGRPGADELAPPVRQVGRDLDPHVRHQPPGLGDQPLHVLDAHRARPRWQWQLRTAVGHPRAPVLARGRVRDLRGLFSVVALVGHEVLQDHLLEVAVLGVRRRERLERFDALLF